MLPAFSSIPPFPGHTLKMLPAFFSIPPFPGHTLKMLPAFFSIPPFPGHKKTLKDNPAGFLFNNYSSKTI